MESSLTAAEPAWLALLRAELAATSDEVARQLWPSPRPGLPPFFDYRLEHVRQVEREARSLLAAVGGDPEIVLAAVWLHDRFQPGFVGPDHGRRAAAWAAEHLAARGFPAEKVAAVCFAVARHSDPPDALPDALPEARLLWDADKLSHLGPVELLARFLNQAASDMLGTLEASPAFPERRLTLRDLARRAQAWQERDFAADLAAQFYFAPARKWARERLTAQRAFVAGLLAQTAG